MNILLPAGYKVSLEFIPYTWSSSSSPETSIDFDLLYSKKYWFIQGQVIKKLYLSTYHNMHQLHSSVRGCTKSEQGTLRQRKGGSKLGELSPCEYIPSENIIQIVDQFSMFKLLE